MYWKRGTVRQSTVTAPFCVREENYDFTLTLVAEEDITSAFLCLYDDTFEGVISAKLSTESTYKDIPLLGIGNCHIGDVSTGNTIDVDFRLNFTSDYDLGKFNIPIIVYYGELNSFMIVGELWSDSYDPPLWADDYTDQNLWAEEY